MTAQLAGWLITVIAVLPGCFDFDVQTACSRDRGRCTKNDASVDVTVDSGSLQDAAMDTGPDIADVGGREAVAVAEETCARLTACNQGVGAGSFAECVRDLAAVLADRSDPPLGAALWSCLRVAKSCSDVNACTGGATAAAACASAGSGTSQICVAGSRVTCSGGTNVGVELCRLAGRSCVTMSATTAACTASTLCPITSPACSGDQLVACEGSLDKGSDCKALGGACGASEGKSGCAGGRTACSSADATCAGDTADFCRFGRAVRFDCAAMGHRCEAGPGKGCVALSAECRETDAASCDGTRVQYCLGGKLRAVDCSMFALGGCRPVFSSDGSSVACGAS